MKTYMVTMQSPRSGKLESYQTQARTEEELEPYLEIFREAGYTQITYQEERFV